MALINTLNDLITYEAVNSRWMYFYWLSPKMIDKLIARKTKLAVKKLMTYSDYHQLISSENKEDVK